MLWNCSENISGKCWDWKRNRVWNCPWNTSGMWQEIGSSCSETPPKLPVEYDTFEKGKLLWNCSRGDSAIWQLSLKATSWVTPWNCSEKNLTTVSGMTDNCSETNRKLSVEHDRICFLKRSGTVSGTWQQCALHYPETALKLLEKLLWNCPRAAGDT